MICNGLKRWQLLFKVSNKHTFYVHRTQACRQVTLIRDFFLFAAFSLRHHLYAAHVAHGPDTDPTRDLIPKDLKEASPESAYALLAGSSVKYTLDDFNDKEATTMLNMARPWSIHVKDSETGWSKE